jgi:hypothetical protein
VKTRAEKLEEIFKNTTIKFLHNIPASNLQKFFVEGVKINNEAK